jgi:hypothetical protein
MNRIYKNWTFHNIIAHPLSEVVYWIVRPFGKSTSEKISKRIHDCTLPADSEGNDG